ncbi:MAG: bacteriohopanetetrol glucosamine biosynthesis glycosyltransferase HpnI [Gammaproteobacteria bacterium]|nr:bacteriohopanetetrol glucosamine biosynthesis glycosyltransferase HpnI [Gammaproteobacteria bacterium]
MISALQALSLMMLPSFVYEGAAIAALWRWRRRAQPEAPVTPPVTILKPLHGEEPELYANLRSFCCQRYPVFQIICGVHDADDPAVTVVRRLQAEFPEHDLRLVIDECCIGVNRKVSNLHNMLSDARHDILVLSDADVRVGPEYLRTVVGPLADPAVGVVTCLYQGVPDKGMGSRLLAQHVNEGFVPAVLVAQRLGPNTFCGGATLALRRSTLDAIGGFPALADHLADDYLLAARARALGLRTVLSTYLVETLVREDSLVTAYRHALRWARTIRSVQPLGQALSFLTYPLPMALFGALVGGPAGLAILGLALTLRITLHFAANQALGATSPRGAWTFWAADLVGFVIWLHALFGCKVRWRQESYSIRADGRMERTHGALR